MIDIKRISALLLSAIIFAVSLLAYPQGSNHSIGDKNGNSISKFESSLLSNTLKSDPKPVQWKVAKITDQQSAFDGLRFGNYPLGSTFISASMYKREILFSAKWQSNLLAIIFPFHTFF